MIESGPASFTPACTSTRFPDCVRPSPWLGSRSRPGGCARCGRWLGSAETRGTGVNHSESGQIPIKPGDIILIPANEKHMTVNTGTEPLVLLCFFPVPDVSARTQEFASFEA